MKVVDQSTERCIVPFILFNFFTTVHCCINFFNKMQWVNWQVMTGVSLGTEQSTFSSSKCYNGAVGEVLQERVRRQVK